MGREERTVEVTVIAATDLKKVSKFGREQKCYVVAYVYPARKVTSPTDFYGGVNPVWNASLKVKCYETDIHPETAPRSAGSSTSSPSAQVLTLEIYSHVGGLFHKADKHVGTVAVPLQRVASAAQAGGAMPAFDVHLASGGVQGSFNLSVKLGATRELGEYDDLSAALPSSSSNDQEAPPAINPQVSGKVPSTQPGGQTIQGQSSHGAYPPPSDYSTASPSKNPFATEGQSSYGNNPPKSTNPFAAEGQSSYGNNPPKSTNPFAAEGQSSYGNNPPKSTNPFAAEGQSSYGNNPPTSKNAFATEGQSSYSNSPPTSKNPFATEGQSSYGNNSPSNPSTSAAEDDVVTGYPAPAYSFAPLGQLPRQEPEQQARPSNTGPGPYATYAPERQGVYGLGTTQHGPYATLEPAELSRRQRKRERKASGTGGRRRGPIGLGIMALQAAFAPLTMMGPGHGSQQQGSNAVDAPSSSSSSWPPQPQDPTYGRGKGSQPPHPEDPTYGQGKGRYS